MTRKITLSIILIILIVGCYQLMFGNEEILRKKIASVTQLSSASKDLDTAVAQLEKNSTTDFATKKKKLTKIIEKYNKAKQEYEALIPQVSTSAANTLLNVEENDLKDIYDVDFLWTIVGNYATEEGINLKFDINKNTTSASSLKNNSTNYVVCDLKFIISGNYINLTDFIYDIEDDDRLNFEINDFEMQKGGENLEVTLTVREIKVNSANLIDTTSISNSINTETEENDVQSIDSTTSTNTLKNETSNTTMSNTTTNTMTTNTTNSTSINNIN